MKRLQILVFIWILCVVLNPLQAQECSFEAPIIENQYQFITLNQASLHAFSTIPINEWRWYESDGITPIQNNSHIYTYKKNYPLFESDTTLTFFVSYIATDATTGLQCESEKREAKIFFVIGDCQMPTNVTLSSSDPDLALCPGDSLTITSNSQQNTTYYEFMWYKDSITPFTKILGPYAHITSSKYIVTYENPGTYFLLVKNRDVFNQPVCSKHASITITSAESPTPPITTSATMYEDDVTIPELRTDADTDVWYSDALCTTQISVGSSYVPSQKPTHTETFYVRRSNQYSCYSDTVPVRLVYITNEFMFESQQLQETIDSAETLITQAQELKADELRTYQAGAIADLQDEIDAAQAVLENLLATTQDVQQANASLKQAIETFHSMEITDILYTTSHLYIYPNPCNDILYIANTSEYIGIRITNTVGVVVFESEQTICSIAHIPNGVYTVEVLTKSGVYRELVIKQ